MLAALEEDENRAVALFLKLLVFTGMRSGEATGLRWENVDLEGRRLQLPDTKSGKSQIVVLSPEARDILEECQEFCTEGNPFVFPSLGDAVMHTLRLAAGQLRGGRKVVNRPYSG